MAEGARPGGGAGEFAALRSKLARRALIVSVSLFAAGLLAFFATAFAHAGMLVLVPVAVCYVAPFVLHWLQIVRPRHYYSMVSSRSGSGEHRCVFCGNRGIFRRGEYKTDNVYAQCSRCGEQLFIE